MPHFYERNIIEIKDSYQTFLVNILTPLIYEGVLSIYKNAKEYHVNILKRSKQEPDVKVPSVLKNFQIFLKNTPSWNTNTISNETNRIKEKSKCSDYFDNLVKGVVKSYIVLLTFNTSQNESELINNKYHEKVDTCNFIHKCYIECARSIYNFPELFWDNFPPIEIKRNQRETFNIIKQSIKEAIRKLLPLKLILSEFLKQEYTKEIEDVEEKIPLSAYKNIKAMLDKDLKDNYSRYNTSNESSSDSDDSSTSDSSSEDGLESIKNKLTNILSQKNTDDDKLIKSIFLKNSNSDNSKNLVEIVNTNSNKQLDKTQNTNLENKNKFEDIFSLNNKNDKNVILLKTEPKENPVNDENLVNKNLNSLNNNEQSNQVQNLNTNTNTNMHSIIQNGSSVDNKLEHNSKDSNNIVQNIENIQTDNLKNNSKLVLKPNNTGDKIKISNNNSNNNTNNSNNESIKSKFFANYFD